MLFRSPNLASIQQALQVSKESYLAVHTLDVMFGAVYMLFMMSIAHRVISLFLPRFKKRETTYKIQNESNVMLSLSEWIKRPNYKKVALSLLFALLIAGVSAGVGLLVNVPAFQMAIIILLITTLSLMASFIPSVKKLDRSYDIGMYIILIFSIAVASMADLNKIVSMSSSLAGFIAIVMFGTIALHLLFCRWFKVDSDTMMVTSAALICSPPFVPVVCGAINNKEVMLSGITVGIIGYSIGNYLGVILAYFLHWIR